ncbi:phage gp6-like head-tail connector protein [Sinorhizobium meliloti]|nr:phage gp6-like head-tail connector protein [Sinorhizobium meliloti]
MITLADAKQQLNLTDDDADDDALITRLIAAASAHLSALGVDMTADPLPADVTHAALMLMAHFYEHREAMTDAPLARVSIGVDRLIAPYRDISI